MNKATIFDIQRASYVDGPGIRTTVFFKGCNLNCKWCHNPESQKKDKQLLFFKNKCNGCGKCKTVCPYSLEKCDLCGKCALYCPNDAREICGKEYTVEEVVAEVVKDKDYYKDTGGVTFSGGECMLQIDFLQEALKACKEKGIHTAVDTAGYVSWGYFERILPYADLFLYDVKCINDETHKRDVGASNALILENLQKLLAMGKAVWVRVPVIPTVNASEEKLTAIKEFLDGCAKPEKIELLPYHAMGEHKWEAVGLKAQTYQAPTEEEMKKWKAIFNL